MDLPVLLAVMARLAGAPTMVIRDPNHHGKLLDQIGQRKRATQLRQRAAHQAQTLGGETASV